MPHTNPVRQWLSTCGQRTERGACLEQLTASSIFYNFDSEIVIEFPLFYVTNLMTRYSIRFLFLAAPQGFAQRQTVLYSLNYYSVYIWNFSMGGFSEPV